MSVYRVEVSSAPGSADPRGEDALNKARAAGIEKLPTSIETTAVYLLEGDLDTAALERVTEELLCDHISERATVGTSELRAQSSIEVHPLPGVMDPSAQAVELAIDRLLGKKVAVQTGWRYDFQGIETSDAKSLTQRCLANEIVSGIHTEPFFPDAFEHGHDHDMSVPEVPITNLTDSALEALSRDAHMFLDLEEMRTIQAHYKNLGREPKEIELETLAQTWSEHCVHKTLKATIRYTGPSLSNRPGHEYHSGDSATIHNLLKCTVAAATHELIDEGLDWCLSVFVDNAGIIEFDDDHAVCFKAETHNHPSALEPYGGAATGIGGCIRDIMGTGLAAKPIAATDVFCVAHFDHEVPKGCLKPRRILGEVVRGVRDYGNRMGIPTLNGNVWFDDRYVGNPLVFCGCIGVMPKDLISGDAQRGDRIVAIGGRTGRDGIHGATFSSAELTDTHADEFSHAVQIGNAITEKKALDAILEARDYPSGCLYSAITDCGAGGFSSAVGEMGEHIGATVQLEQAPLKYRGLTPSEIWISEAQERMVLSVPESNIAALKEICQRHDAELCDLGTFGTDNNELVLRYSEKEVGRLSMQFMHDGLPETTRVASWSPKATERGGDKDIDVQALLPQLLSHPNIASKQCIIQQYDHEVQGRSVVRPVVGPHGTGPSDAAVVTPVRGSTRGLAIANGLATELEDDPYVLAASGIDECVRNIVCVGGDPTRIAILDNFCWPSAKDEDSLGRLVRCCHGCYDAAKAYKTPFISGKDSLNNQFTTEDGKTICIPPTLLISGFGIVHDIHKCITMDAKSSGNILVLVGQTKDEMGGSFALQREPEWNCNTSLPNVCFQSGPANASAVHKAIQSGFVRSAHDCSEGGLLLAAAEMAFSGNLGVTLNVPNDLPFATMCFSETPSRYILEVEPQHTDALLSTLGSVPKTIVGTFTDDSTVCAHACSWNIDDLRNSWLGGLQL
ncbi:MAG: phosphoribosylformylglycinamidine synthase subunit PurL [Phycisphaerales bacterium]|jgi:phosphoribosylformylglycinamidine synthase|nr:phosphoribosylformylglycinamidine synthase subunit PurL [Phycisphaerales bacterium]